MDPAIERLVWIVRALAKPPEIQSTLFPPFTFPADELILEFEQVFDPTSSRYSDEWTGAQYLSLRAIDQALAELDRALDEDDALALGELDHPRWTEVRRRAREALEAFGWDQGKPEPR